MIKIATVCTGIGSPEAFRLQGFPDDFKKPVSNSQLYKQAGNTISVNVIQAILNNLLKK